MHFIHSSSKDEIIKSRNTIINNNKKDSTSHELTKLSYEEAIQYDKRPFYLFFLHTILKKNIIISTFYNDSLLFPLSIRLIMLIFMIETILFFNAFFILKNI